MNWRDFLALAADTTEADWRTAVIRAYSAAFHFAQTPAAGGAIPGPSRRAPPGPPWPLTG